jgi:hypothetical protein
LPIARLLHLRLLVWNGSVHLNLSLQSGSSFGY